MKTPPRFLFPSLQISLLARPFGWEHASGHPSYKRCKVPPPSLSKCGAEGAFPTNPPFCQAFNRQLSTAKGLEQGSPT